jgi:hypothetical protein
MSSGQMSFWANVFLGKCLSCQTSYGQTSSGQMFIRADVCLGKRLLAKRLMGKFCSGQVSLGKRRITNVHAHPEASMAMYEGVSRRIFDKHDQNLRQTLNVIQT